MSSIVSSSNTKTSMAARPTAQPATVPPIAAPRNWRTPSPTLKLPASVAATAQR